MLDPNKNEPDYMRSPVPASDAEPFEGPGQRTGTFDDAYIEDRADMRPEPEHSLADDLVALYEDGKTYLESELTYQKTRARFVAEKSKSVAVLGAGAIALLHLALIGLTIGLIIALAPILTIWGSTALVVGLLVVGAVILASRLRTHIAEMRGAVGGDDA